MPRRSADRITKATVDGLKPGNTLWDSQLPGFCVRALKHTKSYGMKTVVNGKQKWVTIGQHGPFTPDQARTKALELLSKAKRGEDIGKPPVPEVGKHTVAELCARYLSDYARPSKKVSSVRMDEKNIKNHVIPLVGGLAVEDVTYSHIDRLKIDIAAGKTAPTDPVKQIKAQGGGSAVTGGKGASNRTLALLSKMFNLAVKWGLRPDGTNPVKGITKFQEQAKERFLNNEEIQKLGTALSEMEEKRPIFVAAIRLLILTGARSGEIQTLKWDYVDTQRAIITFPDSKTGKKSIPLSTEVLNVLGNLKRIDGNPYVLPGYRHEAYLVNLRKPWKELCGETGLQNVRIHDLRHTFASVVAGNGTSLSVIGTLLGHKRSSTTERYAHLTNEHVARASQQASSNIGALLLTNNNS